MLISLNLIKTMPHFRKSLQHNAGDALSNFIQLRYNLGTVVFPVYKGLSAWIVHRGRLFSGCGSTVERELPNFLLFYEINYFIFILQWFIEFQSLKIQLKIFSRNFFFLLLCAVK